MKNSMPFRMRCTQSLQELLLYLFGRSSLLFGIAAVIYTLFFAKNRPEEGGVFTNLGRFLDQSLSAHTILGTLIFGFIALLGIVFIWMEGKKPKKLSLLVINLSSRGSISISPKLLEQAITEGLSTLEIPKISLIEITAPDSEALVIRCIFTSQPSPQQESITRNGIESILRNSIGFEGGLTLVIQYFELENRTVPQPEAQASSISEVR